MNSKDLDNLGDFSMLELFRMEIETQSATLTQGLIALEDDPNPAKRPTAKEAEQEWKRIAAGGAIDFIPKKVERVA